jgi:hypothetical protein
LLPPLDDPLPLPEPEPRLVALLVGSVYSTPLSVAAAFMTP